MPYRPRVSFAGGRAGAFTGPEADGASLRMTRVALGEAAGQSAAASRPATLASLMMRAVLARMDLPSVNSAIR